MLSTPPLLTISLDTCIKVHYLPTQDENLRKASRYFAAIADQKKLTIEFYVDSRNRSFVSPKEGLPRALADLKNGQNNGWLPGTGPDYELLKLIMPHIALKIAIANGWTDDIAKLNKQLHEKHDFGCYDSEGADFVPNAQTWADWLEEDRQQALQNNQVSTSTAPVTGATNVTFADLVAFQTPGRWSDYEWDPPVLLLHHHSSE